MKSIFDLRVFCGCLWFGLGYMCTQWQTEQLASLHCAGTTCFLTSDLVLLLCCRLPDDEILRICGGMTAHKSVEPLSVCLSVCLSRYLLCMRHVYMAKLNCWPFLGPFPSHVYNNITCKSHANLWNLLRTTGRLYFTGPHPSTSVWKSVTSRGC